VAGVEVTCLGGADLEITAPISAANLHPIWEPLASPDAGTGRNHQRDKHGPSEVPGLAWLRSRQTEYPMAVLSCTRLDESEVSDGPTIGQLRSVARLLII